MIDGTHRASRPPGQALAQLERDAALQRVGRARRWMVAAAAALTAGFAAVVSAVAPGRTLAAHAPARAHGSRRTPHRPVASPRMPPLASANDLGLQGPSAAPQAAPSPSAAAPSPSAAAPSPSATPAPSPAPAPAQVAPAPEPAPSAPAAVSGGS